MQLCLKILLLILSIFLFSCSTHIENYSNEKVFSINKIKNVGLPKFNDNEDIIFHSHYSLSYNEKHEQANWVAYKLTKDMIRGTGIRKDKFKVDLQVITESSQLSDYKNSGYDRGHLCPAADMKFSQTAIDQTFYMSNMSPQEPYFNRGIWKKLENKIRKWVIEDDELYIATGPILNDINKTIGNNRVSVPKFFYKVVMDLKEPQLKGIGFIIENKKSTESLKSYILSIDEIEKVTGIDFFHFIPDSIENRLEDKATINDWDW